MFDIQVYLINMLDQDSATTLSLLPAVVHSPFAAQQKKIVEQRNQIESTRGSQEISGFVNCSSFTCSGNESFFFSRIYSIESINSRGIARQSQKYTTFKKSCPRRLTPTVLIHRCRSRFRERNICEARFCKSLNRLGYNKTGLVSKNLEYIK